MYKTPTYRDCILKKSRVVLLTVTKLTHMKTFKKHFLLIAAAITVTFSCSKDDSPDAPQNGGEIFTAQVVTVNLPDTDFNANEYQGTIGGIPVTLTVGSDNTLIFMAPLGLEGNQDLIIPALDLTINYNLTATTLDKSPDETIEDLTANLDTFTQLVDETTEGVTTKHNIEVFMNYYAHAGVEEKTDIAIIYKANKALIDELISYNGNTDRGIFGDTLVFIQKHGKAVAAIGIGVALVASATTIAPIVLGIACIAAGSYKAYKANADAVDNVYATISLKAASWRGTNGRGENGIMLSDGEARTLPFELVDRKLIESDAQNNEPIAQEYFTSHNLYNFYAQKTNDIIDSTNAAKGTDFSDLQLEELPETSPEVNNPINEELFSKVQFSINHPNVQLVSAVFDGDGQLKIKVKIVGIPTTNPVETTLNYTYDDDFSSFTGSLPIEVSKTPSEIDLSGTWTMSPVLGSGICDEILVIDEAGGLLNFKFNEDNSITFLTDPADMGLNGSDFTQTYNLTEDVILITVTSPDGSFILETNAYNNTNHTFTGTYINTWTGDNESCTNTVTLTKN
jgi:hypothetical protein